MDSTLVIVPLPSALEACSRAAYPTAAAVPVDRSPMRPKMKKTEAPREKLDDERHVDMDFFD
jgi:hypothetical protein